VRLHVKRAKRVVINVLQVGNRLVGERFELVRKLGQGGVGVVFEAVDHHGGGRVALKTVQQLDGRSLYNFKKEFRALEDIHHPNLVQLRELHCEDELWFFTMELVEGLDLLSYIRRAPSAVETFDAAEPLSALDSDDYAPDHLPTPVDRQREVASGEVHQQRLCEVFFQLVDALDAIHRVGRVHRDVKPSNVLVTDAGRVVLLDFGLISELQSQHFRPTGEHSFSGTIRYMAPEQAMAKDVGPSADFYALGVMLYEILCGEAPFIGQGVRIINKKVYGKFTRAAYRVDAMPALAELCDALLDPEPSARPGAGELLEAFGVGVRSLDRTSSDRGVLGQVFVGRKAELTALEACWAEVDHGHPVAMVVTGAAGVGKSALVRQFVEQRAAADDALLLLYGRCYEREMVPYKGIDRIVDDLSRYLQGLGDEADALLDDDISALVRLFPVLWQVPAVERRLEAHQMARNPREVRRRGFTSLTTLLRRVACRRRLMLIIDDLQWADADSLALLRDILASPSPPEMLVLATRRPPVEATEGGESASSEDVSPDEVHRLPGAVHHIELTGLSDAEVGELMEAFGVSVGWSASSLAYETGGHPLFVQQLLQDTEVRDSIQSDAQKSDQKSDQAIDRQADLEEVLWRRIGATSGTTRRLIELAAVAGVPIENDLLALAIGTPAPESLEIARRAQTQMLLRIESRGSETMVEPYHDRVREAAMRFMAPEDRRLFHAQLVHALEHTELAGARPHQMVRHLEGAGASGRAAVFAVQAAKKAAEAMAFERAAELYRQALRIGDYPAVRRHELRLEVARALNHAGHGIEAAEVYLEVLEAMPPDERTELRRRAAEAFMTNGDVERGMALLDQVLDDVGVSMPSRTLTFLWRVIWQRLIFAVFGLRRRQKQGPKAELMRERLEVFATLARRLAPIDTLRGFDFQNRELRLALSYGDDRQLAAAIATEASYRSSAATDKGVAAAYKLLDRARGLSQGLHDPWIDHYVAVQWGIICFFADRFQLAADTLEEATRWFVREAPGEQYIVNSARLFLMFSLRHLGQVERLSGLFEEFSRDARHRNDRLILTTMGASTHIYWLFKDKPDEVLRQLDEASWMPPKDSIHLQHWFQFVARGEVAIYQGRPGEFLAEEPRELRRLARSPVIFGSRSTLGAHIWLEGRLHAACIDQIHRDQAHRDQAHRDQQADVAGQVRAIRRCVRRLRREDSRMVHLWAQMLEACADAASNEIEQAVASLEAVIEQAGALEMKLCEMAARRRLGELLADETARAHRVEVDAWMESQGVCAPERITELYLPGFASVCCSSES
jgi:tetratricopeptide (TPR) repeat protein